jgi:hypothetical protein
MNGIIFYFLCIFQIFLCLNEGDSYLLPAIPFVKKLVSFGRFEKRRIAERQSIMPVPSRIKALLLSSETETDSSPNQEQLLISIQADDFVQSHHITDILHKWGKSISEKGNAFTVQVSFPFSFCF